MKLLWAVDPANEFDRSVRGVELFLDALAKSSSLSVDAVGVSYPTALGYVKVSRAQPVGLFEAHPTVKRQAWFRKERPLIENSSSQRAAVGELIDFAVEGGYDGIILSKHNKKSRSALIGSFAEMTAFLAPIPLFIVDPAGRIPKRISKVLIPCDVSDESISSLKPIFRLLGVSPKFTLSHYFSPAFASSYLKDEQAGYVDEVNEKATASFARAKKKYPKQTFGFFVRQSAGSIERRLIRESKDDAFDVIALTHQSKGFGGYLLGKLTRYVLQEADRPVLLVRSLRG